MTSGDSCFLENIKFSKDILEKVGLLEFKILRSKRRSKNR